MMMEFSMAGSNQPALPVSPGLTASARSMLCQACGACCATSFDWPRFSTETDAALDRIPMELVDDSLSRMRCVGDRCAALAGQVGRQTACSIYDDRPEVCRACVIGDDACQIARTKHGLPLITAEMTSVPWGTV